MYYVVKAGGFRWAMYENAQ